MKESFVERIKSIYAARDFFLFSSSNCKHFEENPEETEVQTNPPSEILILKEIEKKLVKPHGDQA